MLYTAPVVLLNILSQPLYDNFMMLVVSMSILLSPTLCCETNNCTYVKDLLQAFVANYMLLYGKKNIVYNVHNLVHNADDAARFGALDNISAFPFESFLGRLKKKVRRPQNPVAQIVFFGSLVCTQQWA